MPWPRGFSKKDQIQWVQQRLYEREAEERGINFNLDRQGIPDAKSLNVWLEKMRHRLSWQEIAKKHYGALYNKSKAAAMSAARRACKAVDDSPNPKKKFKYNMDVRVRELFGCTPEDFKRYIDSIRATKSR